MDEADAAAVRPDRSPRPAADLPPRWFEFFVVSAATGVLAVGVAALALALLGRYSLLPALALGTLLWSGLVWLSWRGFRPVEGARPGRNAGTVGALLALVLAGGAAGWYGYQPSQHLLTDRDPGVYVNTSIWISRSGTLIDTHAGDDLGNVPDIGYGSPGIYTTDRGLEFQFNHFTAALGAVAFDLGGTRVLFRFTGAVAALALLVIYAVAARALRSPLLAPAVPIVVGVSLPMLAIARDVYSEPHLLLAVWTSAILAATVWTRPSRSLAVVAGFVAGTLVVIRVESFLYLAALAGVGAFAVVFGRPAVRRAVPYAVLAAVPGMVLGAVDFFLFTGGYSAPTGIGKQASQAATLFLVVAVVGPLLLVLWRRLGWSKWWTDRRRTVIGCGLGALLVSALGLLWLVRPALAVDRDGVERWGVIAAIQQREGQVVDLHRTYFEQSVNWVAWYVGPITVALGITGLGLMVARAAARTAGSSSGARTRLLRHRRSRVPGGAEHQPRPGLGDASARSDRAGGGRARGDGAARSARPTRP